MRRKGWYKKRAGSIFAVCFLAVFLISETGLGWMQTETFISRMETMEQLSRSGDILSLSNASQAPLGEACIAEKSGIHLAGAAAQKNSVHKDWHKGALPLCGVVLFLQVFTLWRVEEKGRPPAQTNSLRRILSYIEKQDGKKNPLSLF